MSERRRDVAAEHRCECQRLLGIRPQPLVTPCLRKRVAEQPMRRCDIVHQVAHLTEPQRRERALRPRLERVKQLFEHRPSARRIARREVVFGRPQRARQPLPCQRGRCQAVRVLLELGRGRGRPPSVGAQRGHLELVGDARVGRIACPGEVRRPVVRVRERSRQACVRVPQRVLVGVAVHIRRQQRVREAQPPVKTLHDSLGERLLQPRIRSGDGRYQHCGGLRRAGAQNQDVPRGSG